MVATAAILHNCEKRVEKSEAEKKLALIYGEYNTFCREYLSATDSGNKRCKIIDSHQKKFSDFGCNLIIFNRGDIVFLNRNLYTENISLQNLKKRCGNTIFDGNNTYIPLCCSEKDIAIGLVINLSVEVDSKKQNKPRCCEVNSAIFRSNELRLTSFTNKSNSVYSPNGEPLFSFSDESHFKKCCRGEVYILILFIFLVIFSSLLCYIDVFNYKATIKRYCASYIAIFGLAAIINKLGLSNNSYLLISILTLVYSYVISNLSLKVQHITLYNLKQIKHLKIIYINLIFITIFLLSLTIENSFNQDNCNIFTSLLPIILFSSSYILLITGCGICNMYKFTKIEKYAIYLICTALLISLLFTNSSLGVIYTIFLFAMTLIIIFRYRYITNINIFILFFILVAIICTIKLSLLCSVNIFNEKLSNINVCSHPSIYELLSKGEFSAIANQPFIEKLNLNIAIFFYVSLTSLAIGLVMLSKRFFLLTFNGKSIADSLPSVFYIIVLIIIIIAILLGRSLVNRYQKNTARSHVEYLSESIISDLEKDRNINIRENINKIESSYNVEVELYNNDGILIYTPKNRDEQNNTIPKILNNQIISTLKNYPSLNFFATEGYNFYPQNLSIYSTLTGGGVVRLSFDKDSISSNLPTSLIIQYVNIFIFIMLISLIYYTIVYYRKRQPYNLFQNNIKSIKLRQSVTTYIPNSQNKLFNSVIEEYNKMLEELKEQHELKLEIERQMTLNKISRTLMHEIKNPLTPIILMSQLSLRVINENRPDSKEILVSKLTSIIEQAYRMSDIVSKVMIDKQTTYDARREVKVLQLFNELKNFFSSYENIKIDVENFTTIQSPKILIDYNDIWSVFTNITINAIHAIEQLPSHRGYVVYRLKNDNNYIYVSVINNGTKIPEESIENIFNYKFTTKENGDGLGLYIASNIVRKAAGKIYLYSSDEFQTEFIVKIPLASMNLIL